MATPAQIEANRKNAKQSTGPRTPEGRVRSSQNAITHGLTSDIPNLPGESSSAFQALLADLRNEHQPVGPTEDILVYKMAVSFFTSVRANALLAGNLDHNERHDNVAQVALMLRYFNTADRAFNRHLADLRKLRKERREEPAQPEEIGSVSQPHTEAAPVPANPPHPEPETRTATATVAPKTLAEPPHPHKKAA